MKSGRAPMAVRIVRWQVRHGRHDLPWQCPDDPYRVWLSEIMLQQTQVVTVLDYFGRFLTRFPDVQSLAGASLDEVLALWSGLGYYSRARNLHHCARQIVAVHGGQFPARARLLAELPGIGRSTAAAIAALCFGERVAILDGNVRRVLTRYLGYAGDLSKTGAVHELWGLAEGLLPVDDLPVTMPRYTQGMMDLGATLCRRREPLCQTCPLAGDCRALALGQPTGFPVKTGKVKRHGESVWLLMVCRADGAVWLSRRASGGVWADLQCFPAFPDPQSLADTLPVQLRPDLRHGVVVKHVLTHKDLLLHPVRIDLAATLTWQPAGPGNWFGPGQWRSLGLPAPIKTLLGKTLQRQPVPGVV